MIRAQACLYTLLLMMVMITPTWAAQPADDQSTPIVGIVEAPPFAMKDGNGNWDGIAVRLWRHVAGDLGLQYELREMSIPDLVAAIEEGKLAAAVTAVVTAEWERLMDFSHPYYSTARHRRARSVLRTRLARRHRQPRLVVVSQDHRPVGLGVDDRRFTRLDVRTTRQSRTVQRSTAQGHCRWALVGCGNDDVRRIRG